MLALFTFPGPTEAPRPDIEGLMAEHGDSLLRLCTLYLRDYQLAEDAVQETFIRAFTKYHTFRGQSTEKTWLTRIAINICKDFMRRRAFGERPQGDELPDRPDEAAGPEAQVVARDRDRRLLEAIQALEPIYREVVLLFYYNGLKVSEIAHTLRTREGTVKTRLMRARMRLEELLEEEML